MKLWQKITLVLFTGLILFPSAVDFAHVFAGHQHYYCNHYAEAHFHEKSVDCEIIHLQHNSFSIPAINLWVLHTPEVDKTSAGKDYIYLSTFQKLHFALRAPPALA
ncbi:hypothetical protein [Salinimicrobium sp. TH3]|uniref:hypothetical protein n=1 Tax=Salinimicrobium sp. TH3 TaxID=2997342 RepID=UPI0022726A1F|nr:hypothetical protein [Salinimicrobium sp. TH3]MCY2687093.1 hypothetical protein [Salinimicrobium sp. TH3]